MDARFERAIVWFRRDVRLDDHVALQQACANAERVVCAFVLDPTLLRGDRAGAPIVQFFFDALAEIRADLRRRGSDLALLEGDAVVELPALARRLGAGAVYFNEDYEPSALTRDAGVRAALIAAGIGVESFTDHVYFGASEIVQPSGKPYVVFTPYRRRWLERYYADPRPAIASTARLEQRLVTREEIGATLEVPVPEDYGHRSSRRYPRAGERRALDLLAKFSRDRLDGYAQSRNVPSVDGTSRLSPHLRAGTIGIRTCVAAAVAAGAGLQRNTGADAWISELIWRDFYQQILRNFPYVADGAFLPAARGLEWRRADAEFAAWCSARTGYPIVDAAMTQLNETGWMHNRLRMIVASFLTKHLLIDWQRGERYFELHLADADLASNNGGWQWSASTGTDAAPYFRIFNPVTQSRAIDPHGDFIRSMLPALGSVDARYIHEPWTIPSLESARIGLRLGRDYPEPIVEHRFARERAIAAFARVLKGSRA